MNIIPAIDIINGHAVRLTKGDYTTQKVYSNNPVELAIMFEDAGFRRLHLVDLDGARTGSIKNIVVLEQIATATSMAIDFGGGVKNILDVETVLNAGAAMVTIGSMAVKQPALLEELLMEFGPDKFLLAADVLHEKVKVSGWQEDSGVDVFEFVGTLISLGARNIFCTDIAKDGMMQGPSIALYKKIIGLHPEINFIASGGVSSINDVIALEEIGCAGIIIGKALYENLVPLEELIIYNK